MNRNSSNLTWQEDFFSPIKIIFDRYLTIAQSCKFTINITKFHSMDYIDRIVIYEKSNSISYKTLNVNDKIPISLNDNISFQSCFLSIKPTVRVEGRYNNIPNYLELDPIRPIIMTSYHPIYDVRLARSNLIEDNWKINPLIQFLNKYGFDCSTLGIEVHGTQNPNDQSFLKCEKEWASQGDCFIAILTERYNTLTKKIPPGWVHAEDGLSYAEGSLFSSRENCKITQRMSAKSIK